MDTLPVRRQVDAPPSSLVSGARVGVVTGVAGAGVAALGTFSLTAGFYTACVAFLVGSVAGPLVSYASRHRSCHSAVPITFSAMGTLAGVLLLPLLAFAVPPDLQLASLVGLPLAVNWGTPFWVLLGGPLGAMTGMLSGLVTEFTPRDPVAPLARPARAALTTGLLTTLLLAPFWSAGLSKSLVITVWETLGPLAGWTMKFFAAAVHGFGPLTLGCLAALAAFGGAMLLEAREEWDRRQTRPFLPPVQSFSGEFDVVPG